MNTQKQTTVMIGFIILAIAAMAGGTLNLLSNPPFQAADEVMHLEAAIVSARNFPNLKSAFEQPDTDLQSRMLQCLSDHAFFPRIGVPEPVPLPASFNDTVFLRDAPSKLGREPIYYLLAGWILRLTGGGILDAMYLCRILNFTLLLLTLVLLFQALAFTSPGSFRTPMLGAILFVLLPGLWHLGVAMTTESWKVFLITLGIYTISHPGRHTHRLRFTGCMLLWLSCVAASRWTLLPPALAIFFAGMIERSADGNSRRWLRIVTIGTGLALGITLPSLLLHNDLLHHEWHHVTSGITRLLQGAADPLPTITTLVQSFWLGFGWLTVPVADSTVWLAWIVTVTWAVFFLVYVVRGMRQSFRSRDPLWFAITLGVAAIGVMVFIRSVSAEPSIQGRYVFPVVPLILIGVVRGIHVSPKTTWLPAVLMMILLTLLNIQACRDGWLWYQHIGYEAVREPVRTMSHLEWLETSRTEVRLEAGSRFAGAFLGRGWYPAEPGAGHRWMLNRAEILLPMLPSMAMHLDLDLLPYHGDPTQPIHCIAQFNGHDVGTWSLYPGHGECSARVDAGWILPGINRLTLQATPALSPFERGESPDRRPLTIAFRKLALLPDESVGTGVPISGWFATSDSPVLLHIEPGIVIRGRSLHPEDQIHSIRSGGTRIVTWGDRLTQQTTQTAIDITDLRFVPASSTHWIDAFDAFRRSVSTLPHPLGIVYLHLLVLGAWWLATIFLGGLGVLVIGHKATLDRNTPGC
ncbi:hypothetical protein JXA80_03890 [bacterium]|nr:hypothetical protein [candidate division CSSED10-310 bacterium]